MRRTFWGITVLLSGSTLVHLAISRIIRMNTTSPPEGLDLDIVSSNPYNSTCSSAESWLTDRPRSYIAYAGARSPTMWSPISELNRTDADVSLVVMAQNSVAYIEPV